MSSMLSTLAAGIMQAEGRTPAGRFSEYDYRLPTEKVRGELKK
jgi:hypothetical protein